MLHSEKTQSPSSNRSTIVRKLHGLFMLRLRSSGHLSDKPFSTLSFVPEFETPEPSLERPPTWACLLRCVPLHMQGKQDSLYNCWFYFGERAIGKAETERARPQCALIDRIGHVQQSLWDNDDEIPEASEPKVVLPTLSRCCLLEGSINHWTPSSSTLVLPRLPHVFRTERLS